MWRIVAVIGGGVVFLGLTLWLVLIASIRTQFEPVLNVVRRMNRRILNPRALKKAGQPGSGPSVIRHVGRVSGTSYETPVVLIEADTGFVVVLPYGASPDWLKNIRVAGSGEVTHQGKTYRVDAFELVGPDRVFPHLSPRDRRNNRLYGIDNFLTMSARVLEGSHR